MDFEEFYGETYDPSLEETEEALEKSLDKLARKGVINDDLYEIAKENLSRIASMMFRINEVDNRLNFLDVALMCIYKVAGEMW